MEGGGLSLDESLRAFERGIALYRRCQAALEQTEARVKLLLDPEHPESAQPFAPEKGP
jgi:exodeoxyribonuclease VII small subunit